MNARKNGTAQNGLTLTTAAAQGIAYAFAPVGTVWEMVQNLLPAPKMTMVAVAVVAEVEVESHVFR